MSEIEILYENAGIEGEWRDYRVKNGKVYNGKNPKNRNIRLCRPCFTPAKQLELIKWLGSSEEHYILEISRPKNWNWYIETIDVAFHSPTSFEETLAGLINFMWQDLTPEEKAEIKEILNEN